MGKNFYPVPNWFRIENYNYSAKLSAVDWLTELSNRQAAFKWLIRKKRGETNEKNTKANAIYGGIWSQIKENGLLNRPTYEHLERIKARLETSGKDHRKELTPEQVDILTSMTTERNYFEDGLKLPVAVAPLKMSEAKFIVSMWGKKGRLHIDGRTVDEASADEPSYDYGDRYLKIEIQAPDDLLAHEFLSWVQMERSKMDERPKIIRQSDFDYWAEYCFLPFLDLDFYSHLEEKPIKNMALGTALFPDEFEVDLAGRIKDTVKKKARILLDKGLIEGLRKQLESEGKVPTSDDY